MRVKSLRRVPTWLMILILLILLLVFLAGCGKLIKYQIEERERPASRLEDVAYGNPGKRDCIIYIRENEQYVPYLVFPSESYDGNLLLIRKELTDETVIYENENVFGAEGSYYPDSNVDKYLNETFINRFTSAMQDAILTSNVEIAALGEVNAQDSFSEGRYKRGTEFIPRKIFLLSAVELGIDSGIAMSAEEGRKIEGLDHFPPESNESYWLRSAYLWDDTHAWAYSPESYGQEGIRTPLPLRPVFTLPPDLAVIERNDIAQDTPIYVLEVDK